MGGFSLRCAGRLRGPILALALPALALGACGSPEPTPVGAAAAALPHCQDYAPAQVLGMDLASQLIWIDEEIERCRKEPAQKAADYLLRGTVLMDLPGNGPELAIQDFSDAIELRPDDAQAYAQRARAKLLLSRYAEALPDSKKAIELQPDAAAYNDLATIHLGLGDVGAAIDDLTAAIELEPGRAQTYHSRGVLYGRIGKADEALADIVTSIRLDPPRAKAWQEAMQALGTYTGPLNGELDKATETAIRRWFIDGMPGDRDDPTASGD